MKNNVNNTPDRQSGTNLYDDGNIPKVDLEQNTALSDESSVEPLPESFRPRKDGPGGN